MKYKSDFKSIDDCLEIEPTYNITGNGAMGLVVTHKLAEDHKTPLMTIDLREDCEEFYFLTVDQVKAFCDVLIELAHEHLPLNAKLRRAADEI